MEIKKIIGEAKEEIRNARIDDKQLTEILTSIMEHLSEMNKIKEFSFSQLHKFEKKQDEIVNQYETYRKVSGKQLTKLVLKDKTMIVLYVLVGIIIVCTIVTHCIGI